MSDPDAMDRCAALGWQHACDLLESVRPDMPAKERVTVLRAVTAWYEAVRGRRTLVDHQHGRDPSPDPDPDPSADLGE